MAAMVQNIYSSVGTQTIFSNQFNAATFTVIPSVGAEFTLLTAVDPKGELVEDPFYNHYKIPAQDWIYNPGKFSIKVIQPGLNGILVQYKTF